LRKEETSAIVTSDEKLDRRERRDRAKECRGACSRRHRQPERVAQGEEEFSFESAITH
jgi:hypothetical protein